MVNTNLPLQLTSFIGRERELAEVERLLYTSRLVTLTGPGGCGKTRLALQVASLAYAAFADGVWLVDLASLQEPTLVPQLVAQALGIHLPPDKSLLELLLRWMESRLLLLVLDNCEHLSDACAQLAQQLLSQAPRLHILATSRQALSVPGEIIYQVAGMALPSVHPGTMSNLPGNPQPGDYLQYDAVQLYVERAQTVLPKFRLRLENALLIGEICRRLDGLPLALELASARVNVLTVQQIAERLDDRFTLLISTQHIEAASRHNTLRAAIDWSYDLLSTPEQILLQRLSVFTAGCSLTAAEAICAGEEIEREQVLNLLSSLVNKSLVAAQTLQRSEARYHMLETIRQYAQAKLIACGEWSTIRDVHLQYFLKLAEETAPKLSGQYQQMWLDWLEGEYGNIRSALAWSLENGRVEAGLRIIIAIYQFWTIRDYVEEGLAWVERLLAQADERISPVVHANALAYAAFLAGFRGNTTAQMGYGREATTLAEAAGDEGKSALVWALAAQAYAARAAGDYHTEFTIGERVIELYRELGDSYLLGVSLSVSSFSAMSIGKYDAAHTMLDEALPLLRELGNPYRIAMALNYLGDLSRCEKDYPSAQTAYEESISLLRKIDAPRDLASVLHNLGHTCLHLGDFERALARITESLEIQQSQQNTPGVVECLIGFAAMAAVSGLYGAGARLLAAAVAIGGQRIATAWAATRMEYEHYLALIRAGLTEVEFKAEQVAGRTLSIEEAVAYAQNLPLRAAAALLNRNKSDELTAREREVAALIARGRSNGEIADELVVSKRTIEKHIAHIIMKLGVTNRAQIVRWAIETGLVNSAQ